MQQRAVSKWKDAAWLLRVEADLRCRAQSVPLCAFDVLPTGIGGSNWDACMGTRTKRA